MKDLPSRLRVGLLASGFLLFAQVSQAAVILSDNTAEVPQNGFLVRSDLRAATAGFSTDSQAYALGEVSLLLQDVTTGGDAVVDVSLYASTGTGIGKPGALVGSLATAPDIPTSLSLVAFGGNDLPLAANSTYWIVLTALSGSVEWWFTSSSNGLGAGFDATWGSSPDGGVTWTTHEGEPQIMRVVANVPEPGTIAVLLLALGGLCASCRKRVTS